MIYFKTDRGVLHQGHVLDVLKELPDESVQMVCTSPPYWGLRVYKGIEPQLWDDPGDCEHVWGNEITKRNRGSMGDKSTLEGGDMVSNIESVQGQFCQHCQAWRGSLGLEPTPELFISHIVQVFREVKRVLHKSGTVWLNLGDSYVANRTGNQGNGKSTLEGGKATQIEAGKRPNKLGNGLKPKDLCGIPWRVALALQADGWYLRSDIIWHKPNPMPESCTDRPTKSHEYLFLLTKNSRYFYDAEAIREPHKEASIKRDKAGYAAAFKGRHTMPGENRPHSTDHNGFNNPAGRNKRTVWTIPTQSFSAAHFATFPEKLVTPCVKAGTSEKGCCPECGEPWVRVVEKTNTPDGNRPHGTHYESDRGDSKQLDKQLTESKTIGWKPECNHYPRTSEWLEYPKKKDKETDETYQIRIEPIRMIRLDLLEFWKPFDVVPCVCFDPFFGSGTVAVVAERLRRNWCGIELSEDYAKIAKDRITHSIRQRRLF